MLRTQVISHVLNVDSGRLAVRPMRQLVTQGVV